jgi:hypothetical protein
MTPSPLLDILAFAVVWCALVAVLVPLVSGQPWRRGR